MFNGLIRELAKVKSLEGDILRLQSKYIPQIGDSIAINGACLTAINTTKDGFDVEISPETRHKVAIENYKDLVHIEPAMRLSDRIDGHLLQGHIDCIGEILQKSKHKNAYEVVIKIPTEFIKFVVPKGSIAIDGVSLTVNDVWSDRFRLTIIPHTYENTLFRYYKIHQRVNIETDMFARYMYHMFAKRTQPNEEIGIWW
ncbi:MAG: riboflavin synthase [Epsilonproteobacteria bacterium]|nr:riboflavin synthase [Campylobacterota bacterium]